MPLWGVQVTADRIDFEWPSQSMIDQMEADVTLSCMTLKSMPNSISSVHLVLSNGWKSPLFERAGFQQEMEQTIEFDFDHPVKAVEASVRKLNDANQFIKRLRFLDERENEVAESYDPY
mmetsp:Transcript_22272/g.26086  ORF Transcript_22272/g.26086 Transcript_22272/m.26086 type:complete len:119 (-) Transcript_22272:205-561(-)|eukprot:CAMPEP_0170451338 /NCGR_PEP_ID=MMETSP0123-20130129/619_1 /TAXON_ID=182087 /ORGANISM="Favella ehrenbergii, Strain Fehren 1" /LENGTH=118 /DNA_ID=CAMNT_0010713009 /DNA_START=418 /DNA_END=774 /DNA_ORIENTATION=-